MFEKISKYFASKATGGAVDGVKQTLTEKFDQYGDILKIGLVASVVAFSVIGGKHMTKKHDRNAYIPNHQYPGNSPVIINNYYYDPNRMNQNYRREERPRYHGNNFIKKQNNPKR